MIKVQKNILLVLDRIKDKCTNDPDEARMYAEQLDEMLNTIGSNDGFGTEQQGDPRGDFRCGSWSITKKIQRWICDT